MAAGSILFSQDEEEALVPAMIPFLLLMIWYRPIVGALKTRFLHEGSGDNPVSKAQCD